MNAITLNNQGVRSMWEWIRGGLLHIIRKTHADWIPEDVYADIMAGTAVVRVYRDANGDDKGFMVLQRHDYKHGTELFVWCMWGELWDMKDGLLADLDALAKSLGANKIRMKSPRKGYLRTGFKLREYVYEREVL